MVRQMLVQLEGERWGEVGQLCLEQQEVTALPVIQCLSIKRQRRASASAFAQESRPSAASFALRGFEAALARL
jgi:hypothetical protein